MAAKKKGKKDEGVVSLEKARARRELDSIVDRMHQISKGMTDTVAEIVGLYHEWEKAHPDKAVAPVDKLEMVEFGFIGKAGFDRCREEHRLPGLALYGEQAEGFAWDEDISDRIMCPALESGRCRPTLEAFDRPPCILLGAEIQQAIAPGSVTDLVDVALDRDWRDDPKTEREREARAKKLVEKHRKLEAAAEKRAAAKRRE